LIRRKHGNISKYMYIILAPMSIYHSRWMI
jgi:hypothetical protein